jgi:hypothetical protein
VDREASMLPPFSQLFPVYGSCPIIHVCPHFFTLVQRQNSNRL